MSFIFHTLELKVIKQGQLSYPNFVRLFPWHLIKIFTHLYLAFMQTLLKNSRFYSFSYFNTDHLENKLNTVLFVFVKNISGVNSLFLDPIET